MFNCHRLTYDACHCDDIYNFKVHTTFYDNTERAFVFVFVLFIGFSSYIIGDLAEKNSEKERSKIK